MKKTLAILLSAVMVLALLAGCGEQKQPDTNDQGNTDASELNVGVFYYDSSDVYNNPNPMSTVLMPSTCSNVEMIGILPPRRTASGFFPNAFSKPFSAA